MLDLKLLHDQLAGLSQDLGTQAQDRSGRVQAALALLARADGLGDRLDEYQELNDKPWRLAIPTGGVTETTPLPTFKGPSTVVATDGSQITPSHHEIALCYLINIGRILYTYGTGELPLQRSVPYLHHGDELRPKVGERRQPMTEELLALQRNQQESAALVELAWLAVNRGHPSLALVDGTLIQFMLEKNDQQRDVFLRSHLDDLDQLRGLRVPVAGYLSNSRSADVVNLLRLVACPKERLECSTCAHHEPPCEEGHLPLHDRRLWAQKLKPGERSPLFYSSSPILKYYPDDQKILFFYLHVGSEVARLEVPRWVADDPELLARVHALAYDQAQKGMGYPITLQEAHNQAVVSREDRARFFSLLSQRMAAAGVQVAVSNKQLKKRAGVV
ncbi:MAG: NurA protein [Cyanobacteria bacterium RYN_339]|nr:NurA protein [Cyanobacteria bacterium RYN_339]